MILQFICNWDVTNKLGCVNCITTCAQIHNILLQICRSPLLHFECYLFCCLHKVKTEYFWTSILLCIFLQILPLNFKISKKTILYMLQLYTTFVKSHPSYLYAISNNSQFCLAPKLSFFIEFRQNWEFSVPSLSDLLYLTDVGIPS